MASISPGSSIIEELVVAAADSIPEGKEGGLCPIKSYFDSLDQQLVGRH